MKMEPMKTKTPQQLLEQLIEKGGAIVSSNDLTPDQIRDAKEKGRFAADENGFGFVRLNYGVRGGKRSPIDAKMVKAALDDCIQYQAPAIPGAVSYQADVRIALTTIAARLNQAIQP